MHRYVQEGMEEKEFEAVREDLGDLLQDYKEFLSASGDENDVME